MRRLGVIVTAIGLALLILSVGANHLGVGNTNSFGWKQWTASITGGAVIVVGLAIMIFARPRGSAGSAG
ncbi:MAG TPA: hypothetical protein VFK76_11370 [Gaiellaceae bacterium]|nr:hypothetical protein [Gaiellaceae bacterium]